LTLAERVRALSGRVYAAGVQGARFKQLRMVLFPGWAAGRIYVDPHDFQGAGGTERRLQVRLGGLSVAEVDVKASHLTLALGTLGVDQIVADPYAFPGLAREVVKHWAKVRLSVGRTPKRWPRRTTAEIAAVPVEVVTRAVYGRWPALEAVAGDWQRWQELEAQALLSAMERLDAPALPVHDALVVPQWAATAAGHMLRQAYQEVAGVEPMVAIRLP
jgi:hypothetical protein